MNLVLINMDKEFWCIALAAGAAGFVLCFMMSAVTIDKLEAALDLAIVEVEISRKLVTKASEILEKNCYQDK